MVSRGLAFGSFLGAFGTTVSFGALLLAACGGGGGGSAAGGSPSVAPSVVVSSRSAVVSADLDADGLPDLAALPRDGSGPGLCWRNMGLGEFAPAPAAWTASTALPAIANDGDACDDAQLTDGFAVRRVPRAGRAAVAYAVLHLGDGTAVTTVDPAEPPVLDLIEPASGSVRALVAIEGSALAARGVATSVTFGTTTATVLFAFPDYVLAVVPDGLPEGPTEVRLTRGDLTSGPAQFTVTARELPVVTSVVPSTVAVGSVAVLRGSHLGTPLDHVDVAFSGSSGTVSARAIGLGHAAAVVVPDGTMSGPATITVNGVTSAPFDVVVGALPAPVVTSISPNAASVGSLVRIVGSDLFAVSEFPAITFSGTPAALFGLDGSGITAIVPPGAKDGDVVVTVSGRASIGAPFTVVARSAPVITGIEPVAAAVGDVVDVKGTDLVDLSAWRPNRFPPLPLLGDLRVTFSGKVAWFVLPRADGLRVVVPPGAVTGDVVVSVNGLASNPVAFDLK
jgi:hypothetical protein